MKTFTLTTGNKIAITISDKYEGQLITKIWEAGDLKRVYISVKVGNSRVNCGFVDLSTGKGALKSNPASWAKQIEVIEITEENEIVILDQVNRPLTTIEKFGYDSVESEDRRDRSYSHILGPDKDI